MGPFQIAVTAAEAAKEAGLPHPVQPIDICNKYAGLFQDLNKKLEISNDGYVRTTSPEHKKTVAVGETVILLAPLSPSLLKHLITD